MEEVEWEEIVEKYLELTEEEPGRTDNNPNELGSGETKRQQKEEQRHVKDQIFNHEEKEDETHSVPN